MGQSDRLLGQASTVPYTPWSGIPGNVNYQDAIKSAALYFPISVSIGIGDWSKGYVRSANNHKLEAFTIYMPLIVPSLGPMTWTTPSKVSFGRKKIPIQIVFGGPSGVAGSLIGLGVKMGSLRQLIRMDHHTYNPNHGGASGLKNDELAVLRDGNFHYHVIEW